MRIVIIILGLASIFATCNKTASIQLDAYKSFSPNGRIIKCHWWQVSGPSTVSFDYPDSILVTVTGSKPIEGMYVIGGRVMDEKGIYSDTTLSYILPQKK